MDVNWAVVGLVVLVMYGSLFGWWVHGSNWTRGGLLVGLVNMAVVAIHLVAPIRGYLDSDYAGYRFGLLALDAGILVTLVTGTIVVLCLASARVAVRGIPGPTMWVVAATDAALLVNLLVPFASASLEEIAAFHINLGEYVTIPGALALFIVVGVFMLPLGGSVWWALRRIRAPAAR